MDSQGTFEELIRDIVLKLLENDETIKNTVSCIVSGSVPLAEPTQDSAKQQSINTDELEKKIKLLEAENSKLIREKEELEQKYKEDIPKTTELCRIKIQEIEARHKQEIDDRDHKHRTETDNLQNMIAHLKTDLADWQNKEKQAQHLYNQEKQTTEDLNRQLAANNQKYHALYQKYQGIEEIYNQYLALGADVICRMERILNATPQPTLNIIEFLAYGLQENNIVALWDSIAGNYEYYDSFGKTEDLVGIFLFFLALYQKISYKSISLERPQFGDIFDERKHTRTASGSVVGRISKVILPGFNIGKNIAKKAFVTVE